MKRLKVFILIFCLAVSIPLAYVIWRTYTSMAQEERSQLNYFSETLLDQMERVLADLIIKEENRSVEEYHHTLAQDGSPLRLSPLAGSPERSFILGYLQNNPDGSFQTPAVADLQNIPAEQRLLIDQLSEINRVFNQKKFTIPKSPPPLTQPPQPEILAEKKMDQAGLADRYLSRTPKIVSKTYLGNKEVRTEEITAQQALNLRQEEQSRLPLSSMAHQSPNVRGQEEDTKKSASGTQALVPDKPSSASAVAKDEDSSAGIAPSERFQVEVAPFQSVFITRDQVFFFRRIAIGNQIYRQGFVIQVTALLQNLVENQFQNQPLSDFMSLHMHIWDHGHDTDVIHVGPWFNAPRFSVQRRFPAPFDFFSATLQADTIPHSATRRPLNLALVILASVLLAGLLAIYQSARTVMAMSERRSQFVSSVTHELKTPLTNIRMYIEMLEQGIAATPEREQAYLQVLDTESARLSRLINNVLELAKLEKKQRRFQYREGDLEDVFSEVSLVMAQKLKLEGFTLDISAAQVPIFAYDREVLVQLLVNLIENSIKFGRQSALKKITIFAGTDQNQIKISVSDTGPGIPRQSIKKVFDDFYRVDNDLTRSTGGTGIGLSLVKKFVETMGGQVRAANNDGPGCTICLFLPLHAGHKGAAS